MEKLYQGPPKNYWNVSYITIWNIYYKILFSFINPTKQGGRFFSFKNCIKLQHARDQWFYFWQGRDKEGLGKISFIRTFLLIFGVHLNIQEFLGSNCKIFSPGAADFLWLHCNLKVTTPPPPPPHWQHLKKTTRRKIEPKINPLLFDSLPSCCISVYPGNL